MFGQKLLMIMAVVVAAVVMTAAGSEYVPRAHLEGYGGAKSHNLTIGQRLPGDYKFLTANVVKKSSFMQVTTIERTFSVRDRYGIITKIELIDQKTDGTGAEATLLKGGPGFRNATIKFKSQRNHGINFVCNLYAR